MKIDKEYLLFRRDVKKRVNEETAQRLRASYRTERESGMVVGVCLILAGVLFFLPFLKAVIQ